MEQKFILVKYIVYSKYRFEYANLTRNIKILNKERNIFLMSLLIIVVFKYQASW